MALKVIQFFFTLLLAGTFAKEPVGATHKPLLHPAFHLQISKSDATIQNEPHTLDSIPHSDPEAPEDTIPQRDVITPMMTVPTVNPSMPATTSPIYNPTPTTTPITNPTTGTPTSTNPTRGTQTPSSGQSWCVASPGASQTGLQVGLDYACGYGGADCSAIQQGGDCFNPDTVRDHASYAYNSYYQKNPTSTSCNFGGTALITSTDPSTSTCQYPSSSTSLSTLNTSNPIGSTVFGSSPFGSSPPDSSDTNPCLIRTTSTFTWTCLLIAFVYLKVWE